MGVRMTSILLCSFVVISIDEAMGDNCDNVLAPMLSCLDYLQNKANSPPSDCCSSFGNVVKIAPQCLCEAANGASQFQVNQTRVVSLPIVCNVDATPVVNVCKNNTGGGSSSSGGNSSKLSYFLVLASLPAIIMYAIMFAAV